MTELPIRTDSQTTGMAAAAFLQSIFVKSCRVLEESQEQDLGIDFKCEIMQGQRPTGKWFNIQCKGKEKVKVENNSIAIPIKVTTINYWLLQPIPTFLIIVDLSTKTFYWSFLRDFIPSLNKKWREQTTVTIKIPAQNCFKNDLPTQIISIVDSYETTPPLNEDCLVNSAHVNDIDIDNSDDLDRLIKDFKEAHHSKNYELYYYLLRKYSLILKKHGKHVVLREICELDLIREDASNLYPSLTYSQCCLVEFSVQKAFVVMHSWLNKGKGISILNTKKKLQFIRTYAEILNAMGKYSQAKELMIKALDNPDLKNSDFKTLSHAYSILGLSYLGCGDDEFALDCLSANLLQQLQGNDHHSIAIAKMNYGIALLKIDNNIDEAKLLFSSALEIFRGSDVRAMHWVNLYLSYCDALLNEAESYDALISALNYSRDNNQCSQEILEILEIFKETILFEKCTTSLIESEIIRINNKIDSILVNDDQLQQIQNDINNLSFFPEKKGATPLRNNIIEFPLNSNLVKSFKKSMLGNSPNGKNSLYNYLVELGSKYDISVSNPFYNNLVVDLCRQDQGYIRQLILSEIENIINQPDRIKLFYIHFLETKQCFIEAMKILNSLKNKDCHRYFSYRGNLLRWSPRKVDEAIEMYKKAINRTENLKHKSKDFNNIAQAIHLHKLTDKYEYAITCCDDSVELRCDTYFFYPLSLKIALKIEKLPSIVGINEIIQNELPHLNGNKKAIEEMRNKVTDRAKKDEVNRIINTLLGG